MGNTQPQSTTEVILSNRKNMNVVLGMIVVLLFATFLTVVVAAPTAAIMLEKDAATKPQVLYSLVAVLALGVTIISATMTSIRARPDDAPVRVISHNRILYAVAALGLFGAIIFGFGIIVGIFNANFTARGDIPLALFWGTAVLLGVGGAILLLTLFSTAVIHALNATTVLLMKNEGKERDPAPTPDTGQRLLTETATGVTVQRGQERTPEPASTAAQSNR